MLIRTRLIGWTGMGALMLCGACMEQGVKPEKDKLALIQPNMTSRAAIEQSFGPPEAIDTVGDKTVLIYSHIKAATGLLGIAGSLDYDRQSYQFVINKSGQVESYNLKEFHGSSGIFGGAGKEAPVVATPVAALPTTSTTP